MTSKGGADTARRSSSRAWIDNTLKKRLASQTSSSVAVRATAASATATNRAP